MKKIMILLAMLAASQLVFAQKSPDAVNKAVNNAKAASADAKKAEKVATWINLGKAYMEAYAAPQLNGIAGMAKEEIQLLMTGVKPTGSTEEVIGGVAYAVDIYPSCKYYYANNQLQFIVTTNPYVGGDLLEEARAAYEKAAELDVKGTKTKDITEAIQKIAQSYTTEATVSYTMGDMGSASSLFEKTAKTLSTKPVAQLDTASLFNAGSTALFAKDYDRTIQLLKVCCDAKFYEDGDVHVRLAEAYKQTGDAESACKVLESGFTLFPANQGILIGLINYYNDKGEDPNKIIDLLKQAQQNEPNNASLYFVEGNILKQLKQFDKAVEAYDKCSEVDAKCEMGFYYKAVMFLELADKYSEDAQNEMNDKKYLELLAQYEDAVIKAIEPLEKAFAMTSNESVKSNVSQYLKNVYYRFREKSPEYQAGYEKYNEIAKQYVGE